MVIATLVAVSMLFGDLPPKNAAPALQNKPAAPVSDIVTDEFAALFETGEYVYSGGKYKEHHFGYRLFVPRTLKPANRYPLIVWFHGLGAAGDDNRRSVHQLELLLHDRDHLETYPFFILAAQCPANDRPWYHTPGAEEPDEMLTVVVSILHKVMQERPIDPDRVYAVGLSSGGLGCWEFVMRHPELVAAFVTMAAGHTDLARTAKLAHTPGWAVINRGELEKSGVEKMVSAMNDAGGRAYLTVLPRNGHDAWTPAFKTPDIWTWLLAQRRGAWVCWTPPPFQPWRWWHVLAVPVMFLVTVRLGWWRWRERVA